MREMISQFQRSSKMVHLLDFARKIRCSRGNFISFNFNIRVQRTLIFRFFPIFFILIFHLLLFFSFFIALKQFFNLAFMFCSLFSNFSFYPLIFVTVVVVLFLLWVKFSLVYPYSILNFCCFLSLFVRHLAVKNDQV